MRFLMDAYAPFGIAIDPSPLDRFILSPVVVSGMARQKSGQSRV
jgi:hypothetical protein